MGLAPAAHGGNRTGRMFTGDESGQLSLRRRSTRSASRTSRRRVARGDGLALSRRAALGGLPLRAAGQPADARRARRTAAVPGARARAASRAARARGARRAGLRRVPARRWRPRARRFRSRGRASRTARDFRIGERPAARDLPPEPAEHVHREADAADAAGRVAAGGEGGGEFPLPADRRGGRLGPPREPIAKAPASSRRSLRAGRGPPLRLLEQRVEGGARVVGRGARRRGCRSGRRSSPARRTCRRWRPSSTAMRAGIGCVHSKRADVSKWEHWLQACSAAPHLRQIASTPIASRSSTFSPQCLQRKTTALS